MERDSCRNGHLLHVHNRYWYKGYLHCKECRSAANKKRAIKNGKNIVCLTCGKELFATSRDKKFCSVQCAGKSSKGTHAITHGKTYTSEYNIWLAMKNRCLRPNSKSYPHYGGRGIKVCDKWLNSFESFYNDMGERPSNKHSIDRINNNGNYEPSNCRWATQSEQSKNRRKFKTGERNALGQFKSAN